MKNPKLNVAKALLIVALLCPTAFADGDQGSGGVTGDPPVATSCEPSLEGDQGSGGLSELPCQDADDDGESVIDAMVDYLGSIFG